MDRLKKSTILAPHNIPLTALWGQGFLWRARNGTYFDGEFSKEIAKIAGEHECPNIAVRPT